MPATPVSQPSKKRLRGGSGGYCMAAWLSRRRRCSKNTAWATGKAVSVKATQQRIGPCRGLLPAYRYTCRSFSSSTGPSQGCTLPWLHIPLALWEAISRQPHRTGQAPQARQQASRAERRRSACRGQVRHALGQLQRGSGWEWQAGASCQSKGVDTGCDRWQRWQKRCRGPHLQAPKSILNCTPEGNLAVSCAWAGRRGKVEGAGARLAVLQPCQDSTAAIASSRRGSAGMQTLGLHIVGVTMVRLCVVLLDHRHRCVTSVTSSVPSRAHKARTQRAACQ